MDPETIGERPAELVLKNIVSRVALRGWRGTRDVWCDDIIFITSYHHTHLWSITYTTRKPLKKKKVSTANLNRTGMECEVVIRYHPTTKWKRDCSVLHFFGHYIIATSWQVNISSLVASCQRDDGMVKGQCSIVQAAEVRFTSPSREEKLTPYLRHNAIRWDNCLSDVRINEEWCQKRSTAAAAL